MSSMKLTIPGLNLKVFGRAIQSLSKIGDELYFEPQEDGLYLRAVNSSRSAYGCFQFSPSFFSQYIDGKDVMSDNPEDNLLRFKLGMKSIMAVFKSLPTIDKMVEKCRVSLDWAEARLVFQMYCRHGIIKTHKLAFIECETLQAVFSKDLCPNKVTAVPKLLCEAVLNFQNTQEEITLVIRPQFTALKNYIDDEPDPNKVVHTQLTLSPEEFEQYQAGVDADVTFCLKEFRAVIGFAEITNLPITLHFEAAGRPITFSITSDLSFEANFVLATLAESESSDMPAPAAARKHTSSTNNASERKTSNKYTKPADKSQSFTPASTNGLHSHTNVLHKTDRPGPSRSANDSISDYDFSVMMDVSVPDESCVPAAPETRPEQTGTGVVSRKKPQLTLSDDEEEVGSDWTKRQKSVGKLFDFQTSSIPTDRVSVQTGRSERETEQNHLGGIPPDQNINIADHNLFVPSSAMRTHSDSSVGQEVPVINQRLLSLKSSRSSSSETSPQISLQDKNLQSASSDSEDDVPMTPPSKKFRSLLFGTQSSTQSTQSQEKAVILAPDSDEED